jgi:hypothetical protein
VARREYFYSPQCAQEGCPERAHYVFERRRDQQDQMEHLRRIGGWRCVRHSEPDVVLSATAPVREHVLVSYEESYGKFWRPEGATKGGSGFVYGPGFKAFAKDIPAGTRLVVTAQLELPPEEAP